MLANEIARCEKEIAMALEANKTARTRMELIGCAIWELDWLSERDSLMEEMAAAEKKVAA